MACSQRLDESLGRIELAEGKAPPRGPTRKPLVCRRLQLTVYAESSAILDFAENGVSHRCNHTVDLRQASSMAVGR
jgi:hypothetical protein